MAVNVVNLTTTNSGLTNMSFYVTKYRNTLSAEALETLVREASPLNSTLSQSGVIITKVYRPTTSNQNQSSGGSTNHQVVLLGVLLAIAGVVILIGALVCIIIVG